MFLWALHWRHNDHDGVSNHQPHDCLLNHLFRRRSKKTSKLPRHWPLCGEFTGTGEFPAQRASYAENVSIWWRHHGLTHCDLIAPYNFLVKKLLIHIRHSSLSHPGIPGFLYRFVHPHRRRRCRPQIIHAITFEQLFEFLSLLARLLALTYRLPVYILVNFRHDLDLEFWRSNMEYAMSHPKMVWLPRNEKQTHRFNSRSQMWPMGLTLAMTLTFEFSRSNVILTIWWPRWGVRIYQIMTRVTSNVSVPSTHLVVWDISLAPYHFLKPMASHLKDPVSWYQGWSIPPSSESDYIQQRWVHYFHDDVMAGCNQATSHYLSQCWPRSLSPHGVTRPQWIKGEAKCLPFCRHHFK